MTEGTLKCIRCGICCYMPCGLGTILDDGLCEYLVGYTDDTTACRLIMENKSVKENMVGTGCMVRRSTEVLVEYKKLLGPWKEALMARAHIGFEEGDDPNNPNELGHP